MKRLMLVAAAAVLTVLMSGAAPTVHAQANAQGTENFTLTGVVLSEGEGGLAWLQEPTLTNNQVVGVRRGGSVGPYRLTAIFEDRVELEGPAGKIFVPLYGAPSSQAAVASPTPARPSFDLGTQLRNLGHQQRVQAPPHRVPPAQPHVPSESGLNAQTNNPSAQSPVSELGALLNQLGKQ
jgi:hypothetical protein